MRPGGLLAAGAISGAVLGAVVFLLWTLGSTAAERQPFSTQDLAPRDVDAYIAVNTAPASSQWIAFSNVLKSINVQDPLRDAWNELLLSELDVDWENEVVPLLGDEGFMAITDLNLLLEEERGMVAAVRLRDTRRTHDLILRLIDDAGEELLEEEYEGETIYYTRGYGFFGGGWDDDWYWDDDWDDDWWEDDWDDEGFWEEISLGGGDPDEPWWHDDDDFLRDEGAFAFVGDVGVLGISREDVQGVIDVIHGRAPSIAENERFRELRDRESDDFLMWGYLDLARFWEFIEEFADDDEWFEDDLFGEDAFNDAKEQADRATFSLRARRDGFVLDTAVYRQPGAPEPDGYLGYNEPFDTRYASEVPEDTLAFLAGYDPYNGLYVPLYDLIAGIPLNFTSPYCGGAFGSIAPLAGIGLSDADDPVFGQFFDDEGNLDFDAYLEWDRQIEEMFTDDDGFVDYGAYFQYIDGLYAEACEEGSETVDEWLREFEQEVGFDLERDLLSLMTGEVAVAFNASDFDADTPEFSILGLVEVTNPDRVRESIEALVRWGEREEGLTSVPPDSAGVQRLYDEDDDSFAWAVTQGTLVASYPATGAEDFAHGRTGRSLADTANWKKTMALLPDETTFVGYVSLARIVDEVGAIEGVAEDFEEFTDGRATFEDLRAIRGLGIAGARVDGGLLTRIVFFVED